MKHQKTAKWWGLKLTLAGIEVAVPKATLAREIPLYAAIDHPLEDPCDDRLLAKGEPGTCEYYTPSMGELFRVFLDFIHRHTKKIASAAHKMLG